MLHYPSKQGPQVKQPTPHRMPLTPALLPQQHTSEVLLIPLNLDDMLFERVLDEGYHSLHPYADQYWLEHVLQYMQMLSQHEQCSDNLLSMLTRICDIHTQLLKDAGGVLPNTVTATNNHLHSLNGLGDIYLLAQTITVCREQKVQRQKGTFAGRYTLLSNLIRCTDMCAENSAEEFTYPTLFSRILKTHHDLVCEVLQAQSIPGLHPNALAKFKEDHRAAAFVCRYANCIHASSGFASAQERDTHETIHGLSYFCNDVSCHYAVEGFRTSRALRQHSQKFHGAQVATIPRKTLRRAQASRQSPDWNTYISPAHSPAPSISPTISFIPSIPNTPEGQVKESFQSRLEPQLNSCIHEFQIGRDCATCSADMTEYGSSKRELPTRTNTQ
jgi:hypothetical protein